MKISGIDFPPGLMKALRDGRLVIFAGAGVSMGEPAWLPNFKKLAAQVARETGKKPEEGETEDRFLGRLRQDGDKVHDLVVRILKENGSSLVPTDLHRDLLRLYPDPGSVRVVTTNFDLLFERAAEAIFKQPPTIYTAPTLPPGREFDGIVHIHGSVDRPGSIVLTDEDFGRAYLTKGWARRFLVEMFAEFTVLFVGYSHDDTIMNYLAKALLGTGDKRFALVSRRKDTVPGRKDTAAGCKDTARWRRLGIEPVAYPPGPPDDGYRGLYEGMQGLAHHVQRGLLDWRREISELAQKGPHDLGAEDTDILDDALSDRAKAGFFVQAAKSPDWIEWLDSRNHLAFLFGDSDWGEREGIIARWLANRFVHEHPDRVLALVARRRMHPNFWFELGRTIGHEARTLDPEALARWVTLLLAKAPEKSERRVWVRLGERCAETGLTDCLIEIFAAIAAPQLAVLSTRFDGDNGKMLSLVEAGSSVDHYVISKFWKKSLKPNIEQAPESLLAVAVEHLMSQHRLLVAWRHADRSWSTASMNRHAIEPHEDDEYPENVDVVIDAARDCLEWLEDKRPAAALRWRERLVGSEAPVLRRLAVHALSECTVSDPNEKIDWLLAHLDLQDEATGREISRLVKLAYPEADRDRRRAVIEAVRDFRFPGDPEEAERRAADYRHWWFRFLVEAAADCDLASEALGQLLKQYPELSGRRETGSGSKPDPTAAKLLASPAAESIDELSSIYPAAGASQGRVAESVEQAVRQNTDWGLDLADALARSENWNPALWEALLDAWRDAKPDDGKCRKILAHLRQPELRQGHAVAIARFLRDLARDDRISDTSLNVAKGIVGALWRDFDRGNPAVRIHRDWLTDAINRTPGLIAEFWLQALSRWRKRQDSVPAALGGVYEKALSEIVEDRSDAGTFGKAVLASQLAFLLTVDEDWTKERLLPLFIADLRPKDRDAVWDGFLARLRFTPRLAELTEEAFLAEIPAKVAALCERRVEIASLPRDQPPRRTFPASAWCRLSLDHPVSPEKLALAHSVTVPGQEVS